ncbi:MAG: glycosyltransferase family 4 protein [Lachnospiraceae bacterium]|nr:glycosyltransferase family 4 protein [Lachnospiraceae bacterium]
MADNKKTVLYLMEYPIDLPGGGQESTKTLCEGLAAGDEFVPVVACPALLHTKEDDLPFKVVTYHSDENRELSKVKRVSNLLGRIAAFYRIIKKIRPDIIHVSMSESMITFGSLRCLGIFSDIPFIYTDRSLAKGYRKHSMACLKMTLRHAARLVTTTEYNAGLWKDLTGTKITVIPNTISLAFSGYDPEGRKRARERYGIAEDETVIGLAGRISEEKDWGRAPSIVAAIKESGIKMKVALVLSLYEKRDEEIAKDLRDGITETVGSGNLIYLQDLNQKEMSDYYYLVDFFIMTSCFESFGKAAVEAMSRKCIVLSTAVGGLPEVVGNTDDLYTVDDLSKLTRRVRELAESPGKESAEREALYRRYRENYTIERNVEGHIRLYKEILGMA